LKWHYIPTKFVPIVPPNAPVHLVLYTHNRVICLAFVPGEDAAVSVAAVLKHLGLMGAVWKKEKNYVLLTKARKVPPVKPKPQPPKELAAAYMALRNGAATKRTRALGAQLVAEKEAAKATLERLLGHYERIYAIKDEKALRKNSADVAAQELAALQNLTGVDFATVQDTNLVIRTNTLAVDKVVLGCFTITVNMQTGRVMRILNDTPIKYQGSICHQNHILGDGMARNICWGNITGLMVKLQATRDIVGLVGTIIEFIEHDGKDSRLTKEFSKRNEKASRKEKNSDSGVHRAKGRPAAKRLPATSRG